MARRAVLFFVGCAVATGVGTYAQPTTAPSLSMMMQSTQTATASIQCSKGTLDLSSDGTKGILVTESSPVSSWTVETGDIIESADGAAVYTPEDLFSIIRETESSTLEVEVLRNSSQVRLALNVPTYKACIPSPPPPPPPPPPTR